MDLLSVIREYEKNKEILSTTEYDIFKYHPLNRKVSERHVQNLIRSIKKNNYLGVMPIVVDSDLQVLDGQYRLAAARNLKIPIHYIIVPKNKIGDDFFLTSKISKNYSLLDAIDFYTKKEGYEDYKIFKEFLDELKISPGSLCSLIGNSIGGSSTTIFKEGRFKLKLSFNKINELIQKYKVLRDILKNADLLSEPYRTIPFCTAFSNFITIIDDPIKWKIFIDKSKMYAKKFDILLSSVKDWEEKFLKIYNNKARSNRISI